MITQITQMALCNLLVQREEAEKKVDAMFHVGEALLKSRVFTHEDMDKLRGRLMEWNQFNIVLLRLMFDGTGISNEYSSAGHDESVPLNPTFNQRWTYIEMDIRAKLEALKAIRWRLPLMEVRRMIYDFFQYHPECGKIGCVCRN